jgi:hypothetical protein
LASRLHRNEVEDQVARAERVSGCSIRSSGLTG